MSTIVYPEHGTAYPWDETRLAGLTPELDVDESRDAVAGRAEFADAYRAKLRDEGKLNTGVGYLPQHMREAGVPSVPGSLAG